MIDRPWREERDHDLPIVLARARTAFWKVVTDNYGDLLDVDSDAPDEKEFRNATESAVLAWLPSLVVETRDLEDVGHVARILDVGTADAERYAVETAVANDAGMPAGEWFRTDGGPGTRSSDEFPSLVAARAYVALLDAGADFHEALSFVYDTCGVKS